MKPDPWTLLGVHPWASAKQIHEAWRRQVGKWHPDRNPSPDATLRLQELNDAYASVRQGTAEGARVAPTEPILAGLSGTVLGREDLRPGRNVRPGMGVELEVPAAEWAADAPVTLGLRLSDQLGAIITLLHPRHFRNGSVIVFPRSGLSPEGTATDLVVTVRVQARPLEPPVAGALQDCA